jgi:putative hydrolase of the HAD superfamily
LTFQSVRRRIRSVRPIDDFRDCQATLFAELSGVSREQAVEWIERRIYDEWMHSFRPIVPYPGLEEVLDEVARRGMALGVLSDFPVAEKLHFLGVAERFSVAMCSEESGYLKPNPEPFAMLARRLGVEPSGILFVGDSYEYDVVGAHSVGFRTAHVSRRGRPAGVADFHFWRYREFLRHLSRF